MILILFRESRLIYQIDSTFSLIYFINFFTHLIERLMINIDYLLKF